MPKKVRPPRRPIPAERVAEYLILLAKEEQDLIAAHEAMLRAKAKFERLSEAHGHIKQAIESFRAYEELVNEEAPDAV